MTISQDTKVVTPFMVSAPGKVILFGEHAAVYGKPAIAAALSLRTYLLVSTESTSQDTVTLNFPDIGFSKQWKVSDFPWDAVSKYQSKPDTVSNKSTEELVPELVSALAAMLVSVKDAFHYSAAYAFVYLYVNLCSKELAGRTYTVRSTLPIGAGLGSSASVGVCLSAALSLLGGHIKQALFTNEDLSATDSDESNFIDEWAFMAEKCIHGNPSGIDNAVACHGGAVMFQRMKSSVPSLRTVMRNFPSFKLLLTDTKQQRRTAHLVGKVSGLVTDFPKTSAAMLDAVENLTNEGYKLMIRPFFDETAKSRFRELIRINHGLLVALGVSHPTLERVKLYCDELEIGDTKLTGAGGGGCAITLLKDTVDEGKIKVLKGKFERQGFETYETTLGGKGVALYFPSELEVLYTAEKMVSLSSRDDIEEAVGMHKPNWYYW